MKRMKLWLLAVFLTGVLIAASVIPASAASLTSYQKKTAQAAEQFAGALIVQTGSGNGWKRSHSSFIKKSKSYYNGTLGTKQKAALAALNTGSYYDEGATRYCRYTSVKFKYKALFGKTPSTLNLPVHDKGNYLGCSKSGSTVYTVMYGFEADLVVSGRSVRKSGSTYIVTEKMKYWHYWGRHSRGLPADQTVTVTIKMKKNSSSSYKYNITGIKLS